MKFFARIPMAKTLFAAAFLSIGLAVGGGAAFAYQGHMVAAQGDLQAARQQLGAALPDKDGHRVQALNLVNQALSEVRAGISAGSR